jgi:tetratricopeptide (TPR) repeat protein
MFWVVVAALVLAFFRDPPLVCRIVVFGVFPLLVLHLVWFAYGPIWWINHRSRGDREAIRRVIQRSLRVPSLFGGNMKYALTTTLAQLETAAGRPEEAERQCRGLLGVWLKASFRARTRIVLADALEAQGRSEAGASERAEAERELARLEGKRGAGKDITLLMARAENAEGRGFDEEAAELYERSIKRAPRMLKMSRNILRLRAGVAALHAGQPDRAQKWAEALAGATGTLSPIVHDLGLAAAVQLGRTDAMRAHVGALERLADDPVERLADEAAVAALGSAATGRRQLGELDEANRLIARARARWGDQEAPWPYAAASAAAELALEAGDPAGAIAAVEQALRATSKMPVSPTSRGRMAAACEATRSRALALDERWADALAAADEARRLGGLNLRIRGTADALAAVFLAHLGRHDEAAEQAARVRDVIGAFPHDPRLRSGLTAGLAGYEQASGRAAEALKLFEASLAAGTIERAEWPRLLFWQGECHARLGNLAKARQCWHDASAFGPGWLYARRAQEALDQAGPPLLADPACSSGKTPGHAL